jgi:hypothetical protein
VAGPSLKGAEAAFLLARPPLNLRLIPVLIRIDVYLFAHHCSGVCREVLSGLLLAVVAHVFFPPRGDGSVSAPVSGVWLHHRWGGGSDPAVLQKPC